MGAVTVRMNEIEQIRSVVESRGRFCFLEEEGVQEICVKQYRYMMGYLGKRGEIRWQTVPGELHNRFG